jgi:tetratricopeptide (TPR) repeat protein
MMDAALKKLSEESIQKFQNGLYKEAAEGFKACIIALNSPDQTLDLAEMRNNLCVALIRLKDFEGALNAVSGTADVFAEANDQKRQGMALANLGNALEGLKRFEEAMAAYEGSRDCFKACSEKKLLAITLRSLSDMQIKTGNKYQAVATLQDAYQQNTDGKLKNKFFSKALQQLTNKLLGK